MNRPGEAADFHLSQVMCAEDDLAQHADAFPSNARVECVMTFDFGQPIGWVACGTNVTLSSGQPPCFEGFCLKKAAESFKADNTAG